MYINKIDDFFNNIIDNLDDYLSIKNDLMKKTILQEKNFVKYQKEINDLVLSYLNIIDLKLLDELIANTTDRNKVINIISKYVWYYFFFYVGIHYKGTEDEFINNIVEFSNNQHKYEYRNDEFFNSQSNGIIIKYFRIFRNILKILQDENEAAILAQQIEYRDTIEILNNIGKDIIEASFKTSNTNQNYSNIIKLVLIIDIYKKQTRKILNDIIESSTEDEYMYIDIVVPNKTNIDYNMIESVLPTNDVENGLANDFWNFLLENQNKNLKYVMMDDKITELMESKLVVPISEDLLLFHKDTELYETEKNKALKKKMETTKIKYIVNKIESMVNYYSPEIKSDPQKQLALKKIFYLPLIDRRAILVNEYEDIDIINKLINLNIKHNEYFSELAHYKVYPYINFKDFKKYGYYLTLTKTINCVRNVSIAETDEFKQKIRNRLQLRTAGKNVPVNIVGLMIPTNMTSLFCLQTNDVIDITKLNKDNKNGYELVLDFLTNSVFKEIKYRSSVYWIFNLENDIVQFDNYDQENKLTSEEQIKLILYKLYQAIKSEIYNFIINKISNNQMINQSFRLFNQIKQKFLKLDRNDYEFANLEKVIIFDKSVKSSGKYDINEDIFHGIVGQIIKLKHIGPKILNPVRKIILNINEVIKTKEIEKDDYVVGLCQHNVTWDSILNIRKSNPNKFSDLLYQFGEKYIIETTDKDYVCKSCGTLLDIKKYINESHYDETSQKFKAISTLMEIPLEEIKEYSKYRNAIGSLDKLIEKIAIISNIPYFVGAQQVKWRRKAIIKDAIDIILLNNILLKKNYKERKENSFKLYGIDKKLSNIFVFEFDNSIFLFTSIEKDYYRLYKYNNVIAYVIILMILEMNESNLIYMSGDKKGLCNYNIFEKYGQTLFGGIKIIINKDFDTEYILKYPVFCYILYMMSCMISKYGMWFFDQYPPNADKKKFQPTIQKIIINTTIDLMNNIIENSVAKKNDRTYDIILIKFFDRLQNLFPKGELLDIFKPEKIAIKNIKSSRDVKIEPVLLSGIHQIQYRPSNYINCPNQREQGKIRIDNLTKYYNISYATNGLDGHFHVWIVDKNKQSVCEICGVLLSDATNRKSDIKITADILYNYKYFKLQKIATKYCLKGGLHQFVYDMDKKKFICTKCKNPETYQYTKKELDTLENVLKAKVEYVEYLTSDKSVKKGRYIDEIISNLINNYNKNSPVDSNYKYIYNFINNINNIIGIEIGSDINIVDNIYIINHDYLGYPLKEPLRLTDKDKKIFIKYNEFFKKNVFTYTSSENIKTDVYYDVISYALLGYKELNKDYVISKNHNIKLIIKYSIIEKLKILGYESSNIDVAEKVEDKQDKLNVYSKIDLNKIDKTFVQEIIKNIIRERIRNLKKIISEFQRFIYKIKNGYVKENVEGDAFYTILEKYSKKLKNINLYDSTGKNKIFANWKIINYYLFLSDASDLQFNVPNIINVEMLSNIDKTGNVILYYIVSELNKLLEYNNDKLMKTNIINFYFDFINYAFDLFNIESITNNFQVKTFMVAIKYTDYVLSSIDYETVTHEIYEEEEEEELTAEDKDKIMDNIEEAQALDIDMSFNYEHNYDRTFTSDNEWNSDYPEPSDYIEITSLV